MHLHFHIILEVLFVHFTQLELFEYIIGLFGFLLSLHSADLSGFPILEHTVTYTISYKESMIATIYTV